jgi:hypothetical protein
MSSEPKLLSKLLVAKLQDRENELLTFLVTVEYYVYEGETVIESYSYWPDNKDMADSVRDYVDNLVL